MVGQPTYTTDRESGLFLSKNYMLLVDIRRATKKPDTLVKCVPGESVTRFWRVSEIKESKRFDQVLPQT